MIKNAWVSPQGRVIIVEHYEHISKAKQICKELALCEKSERKLELLGWVKVTNGMVIFEKCSQAQVNSLIGEVDDVYIKEMLRWLDE